MSWSCKFCTFINSPSQKSTCQICLTASAPPPSSGSSSSLSPAAPQWSCKACTFLNPYKNPHCEVCGTRSCVSSLLNFDDLNDTSCDGDLGSGVGSVFLPLRSCKRNLDERIVAADDDDGDCVELIGASKKKVAMLDDTDSSPAFCSLKILSYNVWFNEELELQKRMKALGDLVQQYSPDFICFQEVTPNIFVIFKHETWWKEYQCSVSSEMADLRPYFCMQLSKMPVKSFSCHPFKNSIMGRELCLAEVEVRGSGSLVVATSHLESPCPGPPKWDQMFSKERIDQAKEAVKLLQKNPNVIFCGDMNWDDKLDGQFPFPEGWVDAWAKLKPREDGWTYDTQSNQMLSANRTLRKRLDRFICNLKDFKICSIDMIGTELIPGLSYCKEKKVRKEVQKLVLPILPSDHFGLLLTISRG